MTIYQLGLTVSRHIRKHTVNKSQTNASNDTFQVGILVVCRKSLVIDHCGSGGNALGNKSTLDFFDYLKGRARKKDLSVLLA